MGQAGETLLVLVDEKLGPVDEALVNLLESLGIVGRELDALPPAAWLRQGQQVLNSDKIVCWEW